MQLKMIETILREALVYKGTVTMYVTNLDTLFSISHSVILHIIPGENILELLYLSVTYIFF